MILLFSSRRNSEVVLEKSTIERTFERFDVGLNKDLASLTLKKTP